MKNPIRIAIIGHIAPPLGGVSVHLQRLQRLLANAVQFVVIDESPRIKPGIFNLRSHRPASYFRMLMCADLVHIHSSDWRLRFFHMLVALVLAKPAVVTLHSHRHASRFIIRADRWVLRRAAQRIFVSERLAQKFKFDDGRSHIMPAFLPPAWALEPPLPPEVSALIRQKKQQGFTIAVSNASRLDIFDGVDLYGLDLCLAACETLKQTGSTVVFLFVVSTPSERLAEINRQIKKSELQNVFYVIQDKLSFLRLIKAADVVVRATSSDGDSLTVREGLLLNRPVVASDCVPRPAGVQLFRNRDAADLALQLQNIQQAETLEAAVNHHDFYLQLYCSTVQTTRVAHETN